MAETTVRGRVGEVEISLSTGKLAQLSDGAVVARVGDTEVLVTATAKRSIREGVDFFPLTVDYVEKFYAAGRIPGGFFKREGRPTEREILICRLIDRPLRPLFPDGYRHETQVVAFIISADTDFHADTLSVTAASMASVSSPALVM